jgi:hypothetical protein
MGLCRFYTHSPDKYLCHGHFGKRKQLLNVASSCFPQVHHSWDDFHYPRCSDPPLVENFNGLAIGTLHFRGLGRYSCGEHSDAECTRLLKPPVSEELGDFEASPSLVDNYTTWTKHIGGDGIAKHQQKRYPVPVSYAKGSAVFAQNVWPSCPNRTKKCGGT